jgi:hypothetical protein
MRAAALLALALALAGCAGETGTPQQDAVGTVATFLSQCARDRPLNAMETLVPGAQRDFVEAGDTLPGCSRTVRLHALTARDFAAARPSLQSFTGQHAVVDIAIARLHTSLDLTYGEGYWRIEGA